MPDGIHSSTSVGVSSELSATDTYSDTVVSVVEETAPTRADGEFADDTIMMSDDSQDNDLPDPQI